LFFTTKLIERGAMLRMNYGNDERYRFKDNASNFETLKEPMHLWMVLYLLKSSLLGRLVDVGNADVSKIDDSYDDWLLVRKTPSLWNQTYYINQVERGAAMHLSELVRIEFFSISFIYIVTH
jgi:hypothetical protein